MAATAPAAAQELQSDRRSYKSVLSEIRIGVAEHAVHLRGDPPPPEDGLSISGQLLFASPKLLAPIFAPRPYLHGALNTAGDTDFYGFGLAWQRTALRKRLTVDGELGISRHNGAIDLPPVGDPRREEVFDSDILFGSRYLFRLAFGIGAQISPHWQVQGFYEHYSNGQILNGSSRRNQGIDNFGVRIGYRFRAVD